jgi:hypothetical protein
MKCTICGSFRKHYDQICGAIDVFEEAGIEVLSPKKSRLIDPEAPFPLLESDSQTETPDEIEARHISAIKDSDFVYLITPDAYVGLSVAIEFGLALRHEKPLYASEHPHSGRETYDDKVADAFFKHFVKQGIFAGVYKPTELVDYFRAEGMLD